MGIPAPVSPLNVGESVMTIEDVQKKIDVNDFSEADEARIRSAIDTLYEGSETARDILDEAAGRIRDTDINFVPGVARVKNQIELDRDIELDIDYAESVVFINQNGQGVSVSLERVLAHELVHLIRDLADNYSLGSGDFDGDTVELTNKIMTELGETDIRISYTGTAQSPTLVAGQDYSMGQAIEGAVVIDGRVDLGSIATSDVIVGEGSTSNQILAGGGNDFVYAGGGNDAITGGAGDDLIDGGANTDIVSYTGKCTDYEITFENGGYNIVDQRSGSPDGTDRVIDVEYVQFSDGTALLQDGGACVGQNVVLAIDVSGSMQDELDQVKSDAQSIVNAIFGSAEDPISSRFAIITFNDTGALRTELPFTDQSTVEARKQAALEAINNVSILGGGAEPLNGALLSAATGGAGPWLANTAGNRVIVFSDEPAADPELRPRALEALAKLNATTTQPLTPSNATTPGSEGGFFEIYSEDLVEENVEEAAVVFPILVGNDSDARRDFQELADGTGGQLFEAGNPEELVEAIINAVTAPPSTGGNGENQFLQGTPNDDRLDGEGGNDRIEGLAGNDTLIGGTGDDNLIGGDGDDDLNGGDGTDRLEGGSGTNVYSGGAGFDIAVLSGGRADYTVTRETTDTNEFIVLTGAGDLGTHKLDASVEQVTFADARVKAGDLEVTDGGGDGGGGGLNAINGTAANNFLSGTPGDDRIDGKGGNDRIEGLDGDDLLIGGAGLDNLLGGSGDDTLDGGDGNDRLEGGSGDNAYAGGDGFDVAVLSGNQSDYAVTREADGTLALSGSGQLGTQRIADDVEQINFADARVKFGDVTGGTPGVNLTGSDVNELLEGGAGNDTLNALGGNDLVRGLAGDDLLLGGEGNDRLEGGEGNDTIRGEAGLDNLIGGAGNDTLDGGAGNDLLAGGSGVNAYAGGDGFDVVRLDGAEADFVVTLEGDLLVLTGQGANASDLGTHRIDPTVELVRFTDVGVGTDDFMN